MKQYQERLYEHWRQTFQVEEVLFHQQTGLQDLIIFQAPGFGRVLALDGVVQVTEGDEFVYHEMLAHTTILAHGAAKRVCIVGGGDGGVLREVLKHRGIEQAVVVEIDRFVVDLCLKYMPKVAGGAFDDPRAELVIADGIEFMAETDRRFDVIIVDSTDPAGPGEVLFTREFYADCKRCLTERGILATQNGVPFMQGEELTNTYRRLKPLFADAGFLMAAVPTYVGGFMALGWASKDPGNRGRDRDEIGRRFEAAGVSTRYYNPDMHLAAFALPQYVRDLMTD